MTHTIAHKHTETLPASMPGLEAGVVYDCESEITFNENGDEESNRLLTIKATVNGIPATLPQFPTEEHGREAREFLSLLRTSARETLYRQEGQQTYTTQQMFPKFKPVLTGDDGYYE